MRAKLRRIPTRLATGAYILSTGVDKLSADDETAKRLHSMASGTWPSLGKLDPATFVKALAISEIGLGTVLLLPLVPSRLAGLGLTTFSAALLAMYLKTPGLRRENSIRPTQQGIAISKDVWMLGIGLSLLVD